MENVLGREASAYLRQHASNPVHWQTWTPETFQRALTSDKPVFVSIGYSTCHWCHVMAHESFEDEQVAAFLNEHFVCIKVDREERPDVDAICMDVCQATTGHGGWPLTIFMDAEMRPFYAGTYFPKHTSHRRIGFLDLCKRIAEVWKSDRERILTSAQGIVDALMKGASADVSADVPKTIVEHVADEHRSMFDHENGGFGRAPKFPSPHHLLYLLRAARSLKDEQLTWMVIQTLRAIRAGGVYDQVGYGLHRYSTDAHWLVPHFEKMLYDQAMMMAACVEAWQSSNDAVLKNMVYELSEYLERELTADSGAFFAAQDADSDGEEGAFYVFTESELITVSGDLSEQGRLGRLLNVRSAGNFTVEASGEHSSANILHTDPNMLDILVSDPTWQLIRQKVLAMRSLRTAPLTDTKILPDWNGLMIWSLAKAYRAFGEERFLGMAERAYQAVQPRTQYLDDHAFLGVAACELYQATATVRYRDDALQFAQDIHTRFTDAGGILRMVPSDQSDIPVLPRVGYDGAYPSGNSMSAYLTAQLGVITQNDVFFDRARSYIRAYGSHLSKAGSGFCMLLCAHDLLEGNPLRIEVYDGENPKVRKSILAEIGMRFLPHMCVSYGTLDHVENRYQPAESLVFVQICSGTFCEVPITTVPDLAQRLEQECSG